MYAVYSSLLQHHHLPAQPDVGGASPAAAASRLGACTDCRFSNCGMRSTTGRALLQRLQRGTRCASGSAMFERLYVCR
jgi:hypothetical protein